MSLIDEGKGPTEVAQIVGVNRASIQRWKKARREHGPEALDSKPVPGRPPKLDDEQKSQLIDELTRGARAHGWKTDLWTCPRIAEVIEREFGVRYHVDHIGRLMRQLGWSHKKPARRAKQRDEQAIAQWVRRDWPLVKKTPAAEGRTSSSSTSQASRSRRR